MALFKVGDKVKILPSAVDIGVSERQIGKIVKINSINNLNSIMIGDSRGNIYGDWCVSKENIALATEIGQQLLFNFIEQELEQ